MRELFIDETGTKVKDNTWWTCGWIKDDAEEEIERAVVEYWSFRSAWQERPVFSTGHLLKCFAVQIESDCQSETNVSTSKAEVIFTWIYNFHVPSRKYTRLK